MAQERKADSETTGKVALVTGSNKGIGFACVERLYNILPDGSTIYLTSRKLDRAKAAKDELLKKYANNKSTSVIKPFEFDVSKDEDIASITKEIKNNGKGIDVIISNAGAPIPHFTDKKNYTLPTSETFLNVANFGNYKLLHSLSSYLNDFARIVIIASGMGVLEKIPDKSKKLIEYLKNDTLTLENLTDITKLYLNDLRSLPQFKNDNNKNKNNDKYSIVLEKELQFSDKWASWANEMSKILQVKCAKILCRLAQENKLNKGKNGIIVNACCPGWVKTDLTRDIVASNPQWADLCRPASEAAMHVCNLAVLPKVLCFIDENKFCNVLKVSYKNGTDLKENQVTIPFGQLVQYGKILDYYGKHAPKPDTNEKEDQKSSE